MEIDYKLLIEYIQKNIKFIFISTLITTSLGFINVLTETPKYDVSAVIAANIEEERAGISSSSLVANLVGGSPKKAFIFEFEETIFSLDVAKQLDEKENLLFKVFEELYDEKTQSYTQIVNLDARLKKIKFWFYGIDYKPVPNHFMLRDYLKNLVSVDYDEFSGLITISSLTSNPEATQEMIKILLRETDNSFKNNDKSNTNAKIDYLYVELSKAKEVKQIAAISEILRSELLKKSLIGSRADYKFRTVRGFEMSEYPVYPNFMFMILLFSAFGFFGSLAYKMLLFIVKSFKV
jgi:capsule polysaccharide export protein KpsE/RkpR